MRIILGLRQFLEKFYILKGRGSYLGLEGGLISDSNSLILDFSQVALPLKLRCPTQIIVEIMYFNSIQLCEIVLSPTYRATANTKTNPNPIPNPNPNRGHRPRPLTPWQSRPGHRPRPLTVAKPAWALTLTSNRLGYI